jgi:hypothetical protein
MLRISIYIYHPELSYQNVFRNHMCSCHSKFWSPVCINLCRWNPEALFQFEDNRQVKHQKFEVYSTTPQKPHNLFFTLCCVLSDCLLIVHKDYQENQKWWVICTNTVSAKCCFLMCETPKALWNFFGWIKEVGFSGWNTSHWVGGEVLLIYVELIATYHQLEGEIKIFSISLGSSDMRVYCLSRRW